MKFITVLVICVLFVIAGKMNYDDAVAAQSEYCQMVADGYWPEFKKGEIDCD